MKEREANFAANADRKISQVNNQHFFFSHHFISFRMNMDLEVVPVLKSSQSLPRRANRGLHR